ncbi:MAG: hypothetical protein V1715_07200 [bacterium]
MIIFRFLPSAGLRFRGAGHDIHLAIPNKSRNISIDFMDRLSRR